MPMSCFLGSALVTFLLPIQICPAVPSRPPAITDSRVDLPQPDAPSITMNSSRATSRSI